jgi:hypothetical protein
VKWLRDIINPIPNNSVIGSKMFVFEEQSEAAAYADFMTKIETNRNIELIKEDDNWDQTGILTKIVTYRRRA